MKELLLDYIVGEILEGKDLKATTQVRKNNYLKDTNSIIVGRDFVCDVKVYFIYDINQPRNISHTTLEDFIEDYLNR